MKKCIHIIEFNVLKKGYMHIDIFLRNGDLFIFIEVYFENQNFKSISGK